MRVLLIVLLVVALLPTMTSAQERQFEVASIRPNKSGPPQSPLALLAGAQIEPPGGQILLRPGGRFTATNVTLFELIRAAYGLPPLQIAGGPRWLSSDRFDVVANAGASATPDQVPSMIKALLAERFQLRTHVEERPLPAYALVVAAGGPKFGARLRPSGTECAPMTPTPRPRSGDGPGAAPPPPTPLPRPANAGVRVGSSEEPLRCPSMFLPGDISAREVSFDQFAARLAPLVRRFVVNRTGLTGTFDVDVAWAADLQASATAGAGDGRTSSLPSAIQEQLGLRLESQTSPVNVLVIDRAELPTPN